MDKTSVLQSLGDLPAWWWGLLGLCLAGFALLRGFVRVRPHAARERALRALREECGHAESASEQAALDGLRDAPRDARHRAPQGPTGLRTLYRTPWFLFLGDRAAQVPQLLAAASHATPMHATAFWQWTALHSMTAIAVEPDAVESPEAPRTRRAWSHALLALAQARERLPLNGIVVCIDAGQLQQDAETVAANSARLRQRVDEVGLQLRLRLPIYVVVTGLESLEGYGVAHAALPAEVRAQAIGHRLRDDRRSTPDEVIGTVFRRLHALRMALLRAHPVAADRLAIHRFFEALQDCETGLRVLAKEMFDQGTAAVPAQSCRGLYLTATGGSVGGCGAFIDDLFERFLPADQPLARVA